MFYFQVWLVFCLYGMLHVHHIWRLQRHNNWTNSSHVTHDVRPSSREEQRFCCASLLSHRLCSDAFWNIKFR